ncbi:hypothetical protein [Vibrio sonorensis]|uniref:hypothetical protein n=1 Tax=Vibrio sonorensis TaxID=1004316 RepID=UPI0008D986B1|nr:hypothetical protein [Vibrio sonorensis]
MKVQTLLNKFKSNKKAANRIVAVIQPKAVYFYSDNDLNLEQSLPIGNRSWQETLVEALSHISAGSAELDLVLDHDSYQIFQIEKPNLPEEEWPSALPFLLKDLITEKVTDIVAQAVALPTGNKIQAFVTSKKMILDLVAKLTGLHISLNRILVEDEVWGYCSKDFPNFLMLQRGTGGAFKISAYVNQVNVFQRSIRGVVPPLTGAAAMALQIDSMALELQRSIDYLSSQYRSTPIHHLLVCCDEEEQKELAELLGQSISVSVVALDEASRLSGEILAEISATVAPFIDLYPEELKPVTEVITLPRVVSVWALVAVVFTATSLYLGNQATNLHNELTGVSGVRARLTAEKEALSAQLRQHQPSPEKVAAIERLKKRIQEMESTLETVDEIEGNQAFGYSGVMMALAELSRDDISLNYIAVEQDLLDLKGLASEARAVPNWVNQFKQELNLVGRTFDKLTLGTDDKERVTFELLTRKEEEQ